MSPGTGAAEAARGPLLASFITFQMILHFLMILKVYNCKYLGMGWGHCRILKRKEHMSGENIWNSFNFSQICSMLWNSESMGSYRSICNGCSQQLLGKQKLSERELKGRRADSPGWEEWPIFLNKDAESHGTSNPTSLTLWLTDPASRLTEVAQQHPKAKAETDSLCPALLCVISLGSGNTGAIGIIPIL